MEELTTMQEFDRWAVNEAHWYKARVDGIDVYYITLQGGIIKVRPLSKSPDHLFVRQVSSTYCP
jgi:hypothetical protein